MGTLIWRGRIQGDTVELTHVASGRVFRSWADAIAFDNYDKS